MLCQLTPKECVTIAITALDKILDLGICYGCALKVVADKYNLDLRHLDDLWIEAKRRKLQGDADANAPATTR